MSGDQFPIGFWNYVPVDKLDPSCVEDWADAGMTLAMSPSFGLEQQEVEKMRAILAAARERGIQVILCHNRLTWRSLAAHGEDQYRKDFRQAAEQLGDHPAAFGFHVGDEPGREQFVDACRALCIQKELGPHLSPFCNLLPWHHGVESRVGYESWATYLDDYVANGQPKFLCYDCYSQMNPGTEGWDMYFRNLREFHEAAQRNGIPFWTTLLSVGHFRYRCPREDDLRWQVNTAVAHGATGLLWFFFYMRQPHDNYRASPIDEHWERTETFEWLSRANRTFLKWHASTVSQMTLRKVSHVGEAWGGFPLFDGTGHVSRARSAHGTPLIVSEFKHENGSDYVAVVNNSQTENTMAELWVRGRGVRLVRTGWMGEEVDATDQSGEDYATAKHWLAPGQMELYRIQTR